MPGHATIAGTLPRLHLLIAADIFGETPPLHRLAAAFGGKYRIVSPYPEPLGILEEDEAYVRFQGIGGLDAYTETLRRNLTDQTADALIGFSVGATAAWRVIAERRSPLPGAAVLFYGSRIRQYTELVPRCPARLFFAADDHAVDSVSIARTLLAAGIDARICPHCRHGFMNPWSSGFEPSAQETGITQTLEALRELLVLG